MQRRYNSTPKRRPAAPRRPQPRRVMTPAERARARQLELAQAEIEMDLAERARRDGNFKLSRMIMETVRGRLDYVQGRKPRGQRVRSQRPGVGALDIEIRNARRRLDLARLGE